MKKVLASLLAVVMLLMCIPLGAVSVSAAELTQSQFEAKLESARKKYPAGTKKYEWSVNGTVVGWECHGYARWLSWYVWGVDFANGRGDNWRLLKATSTTTPIDQLVPGDVIRYRDSTSHAYNHTIFITKIVDNTIYFTDCNSDGANTIKWERSFSKSTLNKYLKIKLYGDEAATYGYIAHYGLNTFTTTPMLTIQYHANGGSIDGEIIGDNYKVTESVGLNMRKDAGVNKAKLTALPQNATFTVKTGDTKTADGYTWGKTTYGGYTGWVVISDFVKKTGSSRSGDYYLASSLVHRTSDNKVLTQIMTYGKTQTNGLWNAASFNLYRSGYQFVGWSADANGDTVIFNQDDVTLKPEDIYPNLKNGSATVTLYAIWERATCAHVPVVVWEGYEPTCAEEGLTDGVECSLCGAVLAEQEIIPMVPHEVVIVEGYEATCTEEGLTDGEECGNCGEMLVEQEWIPTLDHEAVVIPGYAPTCTEDGLTDGEECSVCGEVLVEQETIYAYDHDIEYLEGYEPTCTEDGLSEGEVCTVCGEVLLEQEVIPATGHEVNIVYGYEPTCTVEGLTDGEECWWCGEILVEQQIIPMIPHEPYTVDGYEPTCTEEGLTDGEECWWCGEVLKEQETIPALDHQIVVIEGYEATCTEDGLTDGKECATCGEILVEQEYIYALGHAYSDHYDATCNECGEVREVPEKPPVTPDLPADAPAFVVESVTACEGEEITIAIRTQRNSGIVSLRLEVAYDADVLELISLEEGDFANVVLSPTTRNPFIVNWADAVNPNNTTDGIIVLATFRVKEGAPLGKTEITLTYDSEDVYDQNFDNVGFRVENGYVEVVDYVVGDVNEDGRINNKDLGLLQQYLAGFEVSVNQRAADVNADSRVNNKDLGLLQQYLAGFEVELG